MMISAQAPLGPESYGFVFTGDNQIVTTDAAAGFVAYTIMANGNVTASNILTPNNTGAYCWMVWSPLTGNVYGIAAGPDGNVTEVSYSSSNVLSQVASTYWSNASLTDGIIVSTPSTDYLFILSKTYGITLWKVVSGGSLTWNSGWAYPSGMYNATMGGLAGMVVNTSGASALKGSVFVALALFALLVNF